MKVNLKLMTDKAPSLMDTFKSVAAAFIGVQSNKNREKDFNQGKLSHIIIVGIIVVIVFITALAAVVNLVIPTN